MGNTLNNIQLLERTIAFELRKYSLDSILLNLRNTPKRIEPFVIAGITLFAVRHCLSGERKKKTTSLSRNIFENIIHLVKTYLLEDPLGFDSGVQETSRNSNFVFDLFRIYANQSQYREPYLGGHARAILLYQKIPSSISKGLYEFDLEKSFQNICNISLSDFIIVGFTCFAASYSHPNFTRAYFDKARKDDINLPSDESINFVLDKISAERDKFILLYNKRKQKDDRYIVYDFNPIIQYPIIRPWTHKESYRSKQDRMMVPLPHLVTKRISNGIFYDLYNHYSTTFSIYFGSVFELYVGEILKHSITSEKLISEEMVRERFSSSAGKVVDWIVLDGVTALTVECKATRPSLKAIQTGSEAAIRENLKQIIDGLVQSYKFKESCLLKKKGLEDLHSCSRFISVIATLEPFPLINSAPFRIYIDSELVKKGVSNLDWVILAIDDLERLQPYMANGAKFSRVIDSIGHSLIENVIKRLHEEMPVSFEDSFLYPMQTELFERLGIQHRL